MRPYRKSRNRSSASNASGGGGRSGWPDPNEMMPSPLTPMNEEGESRSLTTVDMRATRPAWSGAIRRGTLEHAVAGRRRWRGGREPQTCSAPSVTESRAERDTGSIPGGAGCGPKPDRSGTRWEKTGEDAQAPAPFRTVDRAPARRAARRRMRGVSGQTRPRAAVRSGRRTARWTAGRPENRRPRSPERIHGLRGPAHRRPVRTHPRARSVDPDATRGAVAPLATTETGWGPSGPAGLPAPEEGYRRSGRAGGGPGSRLWTGAREGRKMACWGRWPHL